MTWLDALKVGFAQCFALIPGTSRSGATIIGGMLFGLSRKAATEFSFFLAVPTLIAAGAYDLLKHRDLFSADDLPACSAVGLVASFVSAFLVIRWLIRYVATHDFRRSPGTASRFGIVVLATALLRLGELEPMNRHGQGRNSFRVRGNRVATLTPTQLWVQGRPALRQPPTMLRCWSASLSPSKPSSTL